MKEKKYYIIKYWHPYHGSTRENPAYAKGSGCLCFYFPLNDPKMIDHCYTSLKRAERVADKKITLYTRCEVIDVTDIVNSMEKGA